MRTVPLTLKEASAYVDKLHRHHAPTCGDKYRVGAEHNGELVGVVQVGRPIARHLDDGKTLEVLRCCTDGTKNACSFLYAKAARIAQEMGYKKIITYILETEDGTSLKASGWHIEQEKCGGGSWSSPSRPRDHYLQMSFLNEERKEKYPTAKKTRWAKDL